MGRSGLSKITLQFWHGVREGAVCPIHLPAPAVALLSLAQYPDPVWILHVSLAGTCSAYAGRGGNALEIKARSVLNAEQPVSKGLVLIRAKLET